MTTVGQINEKISSLRSKIAVTEGVVLYLKTHYMPGENSTPEMHFTRSDYGKVPADHIEKTIADYVEYLDSLKIDLAKLENTEIEVEKPQPKLDFKKTNGQRVVKLKRKETASGASNRNKDQSTAEQHSESGRDG